MDIQLNFINNSAQADNAEIVIFQKNIETGDNHSQVAWLVIRHCACGDNHPFLYPEAMQISAGDSDGNYTPRLDASPATAPPKPRPRSAIPASGCRSTRKAMWTAAIATSASS